MVNFTTAQETDKRATQENFFEELMGKSSPKFSGLTVNGNKFSASQLNKIKF